MFKINDNYLKLPGSYLFSTIAKKVAAYTQANPEQSIIRLGIGDVTQPLAPAIIDALHTAVDEMGVSETFHGYAPDLGYEFLRSAIAKNDYVQRGCDISADEIFISDGAKCDSGNIQEIFSKDNKIAVCDPVYPVYVDTNVMAGRTGVYDAKTEMWSDVIYMPCTAENGFAPELPKETPDIIYLCIPLPSGHSKSSLHFSYSTLPALSAAPFQPLNTRPLLLAEQYTAPHCILCHDVSPTVNAVSHLHISTLLE